MHVSARRRSEDIRSQVHGRESTHARPAKTTKAYLSLTRRFIEQSPQMLRRTPETVAVLYTADGAATSDVHGRPANTAASMAQTHRWNSFH